MANVFASGKIVCMSTRSKEDALKATRRFAHLISKYVDPLVRVCNFRISNLVYSGSVGKCLPLNTLYSRFDKCIYEPTIFPGMKIPIPLENCNKNVIALIFHTGKIIITGAKNEEDVHFGYKYILSKI